VGAWDGRCSQKGTCRFATSTPNDTVDRAVMVKFSKVNAATIKWEDVDPASVVEIADKHWILPEWAADEK
jgi:hypothetical protein